MRVALILLAALALTVPAAAVFASPLQKVELETIDAYIEDQMRAHRIPGLALTVIEGGAIAGVRKMLYTSVIGNGKEAGTLYEPVAAVNRQTEAHLQDSGLDWVIPRNGLYLDIDISHIITVRIKQGG